MDWFVFGLFFVLFLIVIYFWSGVIRPSNFPPGPFALPIVGNLFTCDHNPHVTMQKLKERYGDICSIYNGRKVTVILSNFNTVRKIFMLDSVAGRDTASYVRVDASTQLRVGLTFNEGEVWKTHRRFTLFTLRGFGKGKNWLEDAINSEVDEMCGVLREKDGTPFDPKTLFTSSFANVICALIFGKRYALTDPDFVKLTKMITQNLSGFAVDPTVQMLPFLMWFPNSIRAKILATRQNFRALSAFLKSHVDAHNAEGTRQDYLAAYTDKKNSLRNSELGKVFNEPQLLASISDMFRAGTESTSTTTLWALIFMAQNPEVTRKVQKEIDDHIGRDKPLTYADRGLLPYTESFILEVQRCRTFAPVTLAHKCLEDVVIDGYAIPGGTLVVANVASMHQDPRYWVNPEKFDPARFLDSNGKVTRPDGFSPFSVGKRACLGEGPAKMILFLFITNLLRRFTVKLYPQNLSAKDPRLVMSPLPFEIAFYPRVIN